jgi:hypothetical protein
MNYELEALIRLGLFEKAIKDILENGARLDDITEEAFELFRKYIERN